MITLGTFIIVSMRKVRIRESQMNKNMPNIRIGIKERLVTNQCPCVLVCLYRKDVLLF